jgi:hypothetical protein
MNTKKLLVIICIIVNQFFNFAKAQAPQSFNYQAVARDASGAVLSNQAVSFRISLLQGSATGTSVYTETHAVTTNLLGLVNFAIGGGTVVNGNFATINWAQGPYFAQVELDVANNGTYVIMSTTQLLSVPYAQYAEKSGNPTLHAGSGIAIQNDSIVNTAQNQQINLSGTGQTNITGSYPNYVVNTPNIQAGAGISVNGQTVTNTAPDQTVILNGTGHSTVTGTYPNYIVNTPPYLAGNGIGIDGDTIKNTSPDQIVTINGTGQTTVTGTYPNFTVNTPPYTAGTGINISGTNISAQNTNAIWNANKLQGKDIDTLTPILGKVLQFDGSKWKPSDKLPQMTTAQRETLTNIYVGMTILNTNTDCIEYYNGTKWLGLCGEEGNVGSSIFGGEIKGGSAYQVSENLSVTSGEYLFSINNKAYFKMLVSSTNTFWEWNPSTNQWTQKTSPPFWGLSFCMGNKGVIVKYNVSDVSVTTSIYNPNSNIWSSNINVELPINMQYTNQRYFAFSDSTSAWLWFQNIPTIYSLYRLNNTADTLTLVNSSSINMQPVYSYNQTFVHPNDSIFLYSTEYGLIEFNKQNSNLTLINSDIKKGKLFSIDNKMNLYKSYTNASNIFPTDGIAHGFYTLPNNHVRQSNKHFDSTYFPSLFSIGNHIYSILSNKIYELF